MIDFSRVGVVCHPKIEDVKFIRKILGFFTDYEVFFDPVSSKKLEVKGINIKDMRVDLVLVFGGDGTMLYTLRELSYDPLILGVNLGRVGFLAELDENNAFECLEKLKKRDFRVEEKSKIRVNEKHEALNELALCPILPASLLEFEVMVDGTELVDFRADGVVVATPTGSTAYSLSLGGPIILPDVNAFVISPINSFMQKQKPIVVSQNSKISIKLMRHDRDVHVVVDGFLSGIIHSGETIKLEKSSRKAKFIRFGNDLKLKKIADAV